MKQMFVVVSRNIDEYVQTVVCEDFIEACATQAGLLVGMPAEAMKQLLKKEDIMTIKKTLRRLDGIAWQMMKKRSIFSGCPEETEFRMITSE